MKGRIWAAALAVIAVAALVPAPAAGVSSGCEQIACSSVQFDCHWTCTQCALNPLPDGPNRVCWPP